MTAKKTSKIPVILLGIVLAVLIALCAVVKILSSPGNLTPVSNQSDSDETYDTDNEIDGHTIDNTFSAFTVSSSGETTEEGTDQSADESGDYLCSYSSERLITDSDMAELLNSDYGELPAGKDLKQMIINEMYARHGYQFNNQDIQAYFDQKSWYQEITDRESDMNVIYSGMSDIEKQNIDFLQNYSQ